MNFLLSLLLFVTTGCATRDLVEVDTPAADAPVTATPRAPTRPAAPPADPSPIPATPTAPGCGPNPAATFACAGAVGFCPQWECVDGRWVDVRPPKYGPGTSILHP